MATKKASKTKSAKGSSPKGGKPQQVDDPIIIKGGSISVQFDDTKFRKDPTHSNNKFDHRNSTSTLTQLVIFNRQDNGDYKEFVRLPLQGREKIVICYNLSKCE